MKLVISDAHAGLVRAIGEVLTGAAWQNCLCHLERNVFDRCRTKAQGKAVIAAMSIPLGPLILIWYAQALSTSMKCMKR